jgi:hypothetical protein
MRSDNMIRIRSQRQIANEFERDISALVSQLSAPVDLDEAARERELGMKELPVDYAPQPAQVLTMPLPDYVKHSEDATPTGAVVGEAIVKEYEAAAQEIEALGEQLRAEHAKADERQRSLAEALANLTETAKAYREEAKRVFEQVEACATMANNVSELCQQMRAKLKQREE